MKMHIINLFLLPVIFAGLGLMLCGPALAQTFTTLHSFTVLNNNTNDDGAGPAVGLVISGNILYGATQIGGRSGSGTIFAIRTDGTGFTNLYSFSGGSDGSQPFAHLLLLGTNLYGTTMRGGGLGKGTVFAISIDGTGFTNLYSFTGGVDGDEPTGGLIASGSTLYGTTTGGGSWGRGTIFAVNADSSGFTPLYSFTGGSDGSAPEGDLSLSGDTLYGTTGSMDTPTDSGTVFSLGTDGSSFTTLHAFTNVDPVTLTNSDGSRQEGRLMMSGSTMYGTTAGGGTGASGAVFTLKTDGTGFENLYSFTTTLNNTNTDGAGPFPGVVLSGDTLYGTTFQAGTSGSGTVFALKADGKGFTTLYAFSPLNNWTNIDGAEPLTLLVLSSNTLYGTTRSGGKFGSGTIFSLSLGTVAPPALTLTTSGPNVVLTWPTNATAFVLQSAMNLGSAAAWATNSAPPVVVNGHNVVTITPTASHGFFRLRGP